MPTPFFTPNYQEVGINNLVEFDGQIRLLISRYDEIPSDARVDWLCSGHWVTQAYGFANGSVEEVRGVLLESGSRSSAAGFKATRNAPIIPSDSATAPIGTAAKCGLTAPPAGCDPTVNEIVPTRRAN